MQFDGTMDGEEFNQYKFSKLLYDISYRNDIYYLDLYPLIKNSENPTSYYITEEFHLNERGHTFVAEEIYKKLIEDKLI